MSIIKSIFKVMKNGAWDEHYFKTSSDQVVHTKTDGQASTVKEQLDGLNSALSKISAYETSNNGQWTVVRFSNGWIELLIKAIIPRASTEQYVQEFTFPDGIQIRNPMIQITAGKNGWNVANYYNNYGEEGVSDVINKTNIVFEAKTTQSLMYFFNIRVSGFAV